MKYEKNIKHTFGVEKSGSGHDHLSPHGIIKPHGHEHSSPQPHRTVHSKHEHVCGAEGMESHGSIGKVVPHVPGGNGKAAKIVSDKPVEFRKSM